MDGYIDNEIKVAFYDVRSVLAHLWQLSNAPMYILYIFIDTNNCIFVYISMIFGRYVMK